MIRFLKNLVFFGLACLLPYLLWILAVGTLLPEYLRPNIISGTANVGFTKERLAEARSTESVDVLILGSSHAYRGFDPRVFEKGGIPVFNLGSTAQTPIQSEILLKEFIDSLKPDLVILEVFPWGFTSDGVESSLDLMLQTDEVATSDLFLGTLCLKVVHGAVFDWLNLEQNRMLNRGDKYMTGGYAEMEFRPFRKNWERLEMSDWNEDQFQALIRMSELLESRGVKLILVEAPVSDQFYSPSSGRESFEAWMEEIGTYLNFNDLKSLSDSTHFYDSDHLNQAGVELFNRALIDSLRVKGFVSK